MFWIKFLNTSYGIALSWIPHNTFDDESTLVKVMAWCCQPTSQYLSQCWRRSISPYDIIRPQWVNGVDCELMIWYLAVIFFLSIMWTWYNMVTILPNTLKWHPYLALVGQIDSSVQDCSNSIANALELLQSCIKPLRYGSHLWVQVLIYVLPL